MLFVSITALAQTNVAYQDKNVRISVVTEGVVRLEYSPTGRFVNDSSFIAVNRNYPKAQYKVKNGGTVVISTPKLVLKYKKGTGKFTDKNLSIASPKDNKAITPLSSNRDGNTLTVKIGARKGNYKDMPAQRQFTVQVVASAVPTSVTVNGQKADFTYDGNNLTVCIPVSQTDCSVEKTRA